MIWDLFDKEVENGDKSVVLILKGKWGYGKPNTEY